MEKLREFFPGAFVVAFVVITWVVLKYLLQRWRSNTNHGDSEEGFPLLGINGRKRKTVGDFVWSNRLTVFVNGQQHEIVNPNPSVLLATFIRETVGLKGTKLGCEEGGCGACTVIIENSDGKVVAGNSCLRLLCSNDGMSITTVEGIGSVTGGLSEEQKRLVQNNGTQCGFCTPGWITNMHAYLESNATEGKSFERKDVDNYFDGNICRCTGYRPILQAFQSFAGESRFQVACHQPGQACTSRAAADLEDICGNECPSHRSPSSTEVQITKYTKKQSKPKKAYSVQPLLFVDGTTGKKFYRPLTLEQLSAVMFTEATSVGVDQIKLVGGNTSIGITKYFNGTQPYYVADDYQVLVDVNHVPELTVATYDAVKNELSIGASLTLTSTIKLLQQYAASSQPLWGELQQEVNHGSIFSVTAAHLQKIANTQVRNMGSWAGNLMTFLQYSTFPSDAVLAFANANAVLVICDGDGVCSDVPMADFLTTSTWADFKSTGKFLVAIKLKETTSTLPLALRTVACTFKVAQREHNAHAYVNAGFNFRVSSAVLQGPPTCREARIVFGGVSNKTFIATRTERVLFNASLNVQTLGRALQALQSDLVAIGLNESYDNPAFLTAIAQNCLYQAFLRCYPPGQLPPTVLSAILPWIKPCSRGAEFYPVDRDENPLSPVGKAINKLEGPIQATGQAVYPSDESLPSNGLFGAIVFSTKCAVTLQSIDASAALRLTGVTTVLTAADIPGTNSLSTGNPLLVDLGSVVECVGQPLAIVVAETEAIANLAAASIKVTYGSIGQTPITNLEEAIAKQSYFTDLPPEYTHTEIGDVNSAFASAPYRAKGRLNAAGQCHFYMEAQAAIATWENGDTVRVICGSQDLSMCQSNIAGVLGVHSNQVVVQCQRAGGAFGGKITGVITNASAAALCSQKLQRTVRIFNTRTADMNMIGGREEWIADYDVCFDANGVIQGLKYQFYIDAGCAENDTVGALFMGNAWADNAYYIPNYVADSIVCKTNTPSRTSMRAPGVVQTCLFMEMVLERVAAQLSLPLATVQQRNFISDGKSTINGQIITNCTLSDVWSKVLKRSRYQERVQRVASFNRENLWRKRGIAVCPVKYGMGWNGYNAGVMVGVRSTDGYVTVTHNGCEIGQGINTKVAQAVAMSLGISIDLVRIGRARTDGVVNGGTTGGSGTSEVVVKAALNACTKLNERLAPYRKNTVTTNPLSKKQGSTEDWVQLLQSLPCDVSLNVEGWYSPVQNPNGQMFQYFVYAACVTEVELNVLTGQVHVLASELVYDCGRSLNPAIDIGQIEGALVMGLGYFFQERVKYESGTGILQSIGTWEYKPPLAQDIPSVLNVTLIADAYNKDGILGSKAVGEPPYIVINSAFFALKMAVASARLDAGVGGYFDLPVPATIDVRYTACLVNPSRFVLPC